MSRIAAFFDIDGTIYREGLIIELFKKMVNSEFVAPERWHDEVKPAFEAWDTRQGDYDNYLEKIVDIFKETIRGKSSIHIDWIARKVVEQKGDRVYQFSRNEIERHKHEGHLLIAISGSPYELVREMAGKHKFDDFRGTVYRTDENSLYTGEVIPMWDSASKEKAILQLAEISDIDLSKSYSYGDTNGDMTMFRHTGHPCAINPSRELLTGIYSDKELYSRIKVVVERKDVIYHVDLDTLEFE